MSNKSKSPLVFMVQVLLTLNTSASVEYRCNACIGDSIVEFIDTLEHFKKCTFNANLNTISSKFLQTLNEELAKFYESNPKLIGDKCKNLVLFSSCATLLDDEDALLECHIEKMKMLTHKYREMEACHMEALGPTLSDFIHKHLASDIVPAKELYTRC